MWPLSRCIYIWPLSKCIQNLKTGCNRSWEFCDKKFYWRKKNGQIKEMVSIRRLILSYTMQQVIPNICIKFQNPTCSCSWEIFDTNFPMYYIGVRDGKKEKWKKKAKINLSILIFFPTIYLATQGVYKIWRLALIEAEKSVTESFIGEKEK